MAEKLLYYMDGYHGGIRGHMPLGAWRDILSMLAATPEWRLSIDVEPISWDALRERDPAAYREMRDLFRDQSLSSRLEMVAGSYAQPYGWITDGESNIRHLALGLKMLKKHFPWLTVETYAVQEPCWTSALPQILRSFGFKRAVLKDPSTAWGGYSAGFDAEVCLWRGPDGTTIPMVPRYACEDLVKVWETESCYGEEPFVRKCLENGIAHPTGMYYQDLGWRAEPQLSGAEAAQGQPAPDYAQYTTWKEYFTRIANPPEKEWAVTQEAFLGALPWGERILTRMARQVRRGEIEMLDAERLCALAGAYPYARLEEAWGHVLMTQHHDGWICAGAGDGERNWAWKTSAQIYAAEHIVQELRREALQALADKTCAGERAAGESVVVFNPLARRETRTVDVPFTSPPGTKSVVVEADGKPLVAQYIPNRTFADGSLNAGVARFRAELPGYGCAVFSIAASEAEAPAVAGARAEVADGVATLENGRCRICFDLARGGVISSYYDKDERYEWVDPQSEKAFHEYSGYFVADGRFRSSTETQASAEVVENGPLSAALKLCGAVGGVPFTQELRLYAEGLRLEVGVEFVFPEKTYIGEPHEISDDREARMLDGHRSYHDGRYKLNAWFPTRFAQRHVDKDAAFDVCRSALDDTHFQNWNEIKHNIFLHWVDVTDEARGLAVYADHTTSYTHGGGYPLGLTLAWGWDGGFWWGRRQLKGRHGLSYAIEPHRGDWRAAGIWSACERMLHRPLVQRALGAPHTKEYSALVCEEVELSAAYRDEQGRLIARWFNPYGDVEARIIAGEDICGLAELVALDGEVLARLETRECGEGRRELRLPIQSFAFATVRFTGTR